MLNVSLIYDFILPSLFNYFLGLTNVCRCLLLFLRQKIILLMKKLCKVQFNRKIYKKADLQHKAKKFTLLCVAVYRVSQTLSRRDVYT